MTSLSYQTDKENMFNYFCTFKQFLSLYKLNASTLRAMYYIANFNCLIVILSKKIKLSIKLGYLVHPTLLAYIVHSCKAI